MKLFRIIAYICDIHIGNKRVSAKDMKKQLTDYFFTPLYKMSQLDAVILPGDLTHCNLSLSSEYSNLFDWFGEELVRLARYKGCEIHALEGTSSHDLNHLEWFKKYEDIDDIVFRVHDKFEFGYMFEGSWKVLWLPDKRVNKDTKKHINKLLKSDYDLIVGHGITDKHQFFHQESENDNVNAFVYSMEQLTDICSGPIVFGHIHPYDNYNDRFFYGGSFTKLERSNGSHGILVAGIYELDRSQYKVERLINEASVEYHEIKITKEDLGTYEMNVILDSLRTIVDSKPSRDLFTVRLLLDDGEVHNSKIVQIDEFGKQYKNVSIVKKIISSTELAQKAVAMREKKKRISYLFDDEMPIEEITFKYYEEEVRPNPKYSKYRELYISIDKIKELIS